MLFNILNSDDPLGNKIVFLLIYLFVILTSLAVHEVAHGWMAKKCGDHTAEMMGRLSLNPVKHIDPIGFLMMLIIGVGYAKPVPVNSRNFRKPKRDLGLTAAAGPVSNLILAFVMSFFYILCAYLLARYDNMALVVVLNMTYYFVVLNIGLALFNLIPMPPLDGSKILAAVIPGKHSVKLLQLEKYTRYFFLVLVLVNVINIPGLNLSYYIFYPLTWLRGAIMDVFCMPWIHLFRLLF